MSYDFTSESHEIKVDSKSLRFSIFTYILTTYWLLPSLLTFFLVSSICICDVFLGDNDFKPSKQPVIGLEARALIKQPEQHISLHEQGLTLTQSRDPGDTKIWQGIS